MKNKDKAKITFGAILIMFIVTHALWNIDLTVSSYSTLYQQCRDETGFNLIPYMTNGFWMR